MNLSQLIVVLDRLLNYFIPPDIVADREACKRANVFLISHILGPFIGNVVPGTIYFIDPHPGYQVAVLALSTPDAKTHAWFFLHRCQPSALSYGSLHRSHDDERLCFRHRNLQQDQRAGDKVLIRRRCMFCIAQN